MAQLSSYKGSIDLISGLRPKNNGDFPLMEAHDILVDDSNTRLDEKLSLIASNIEDTNNSITAINNSLDGVEEALESI